MTNVELFATLSFFQKDLDHQTILNFELLDIWITSLKPFKKKLPNFSK